MRMNRYNSFLHSLTSNPIGLTIISKLIKDTKLDDFFEKNSRLEKELMFLAPIDSYFNNLEKDVVDKLFNMSLLDKKEILMTHIIIKKKSMLFENILNDVMSYENGKINGIDILAKQSFNYGNIIVLPIKSLILNKRFKVRLFPDVFNYLLNEERQDVAFILNQPKEIIRKIGLNLSFKDLINMCSASKDLNNILCRDNLFWQEKIKKDFPDSEKKPFTYTFKEFYRSLFLEKKSKRFFYDVETASKAASYFANLNINN